MNDNWVSGMYAIIKRLFKQLKQGHQIVSPQPSLKE